VAGHGTGTWHGRPARGRWFHSRLSELSTAHGRDARATFSVMRITLLIIATLGLVAVGSSQDPSTLPASRGMKLDLIRVSFPLLREKFSLAVDKDFEVLKDELKGRPHELRGDSYWLVHVKAKHSGYFVLTYSYKENDPHYSHVERDFLLRIGPSGCRRGPPYTGSYARFCVGDRIIVPIIINNFSSQEFALTSKQYSSKDDESFEKERPAVKDSGTATASVANPAADLIRFVGCTSNKLLHRNGGYTLENFATFEAIKPGRLNLGVGLSPSTNPDDGIPIIIVARDTPVTLLASRQEVRGYSKGYDGREWVSSTSGDAFMSDLMILQPGDRISINYRTSRRSREFEMKEPAESVDVVEPVISKLPFKLKTDNSFTGWLADYLPN
jgi:hypothetical protein